MIPTRAALLILPLLLTTSALAQDLDLLDGDDDTTTDDKRLPKVLSNTSGFVYYVAIAGITGAAESNAAVVAPEVARIKRHTDLPVCVGFGVKSPEGARAMARAADGVVVGSAIVARIAAGDSVPQVLDFVRSLAEGVHGR